MKIAQHQTQCLAMYIRLKNKKKSQTQPHMVGGSILLTQQRTSRKDQAIIALDL